MSGYEELPPRADGQERLDPAVEVGIEGQGSGTEARQRSEEDDIGAGDLHGEVLELESSGGHGDRRRTQVSRLEHGVADRPGREFGEIGGVFRVERRPHARIAGLIEMGAGLGAAVDGRQGEGGGATDEVDV